MTTPSGHPVTGRVQVVADSMKAEVGRRVPVSTPRPVDNQVDGVEEAGPVHWSTRPGETLVAAAVAVVLGAGVLLVDTPGRVLLGAATLLLVAVVVRDLVLRPRLLADEAQVVVATLGGRTVIPRERLRARVRTGRRLGMRSTTLELEDTGDDTVLLVLGRRDLGTDPEQVGAQLLGHRPV